MLASATSWEDVSLSPLQIEAVRTKFDPILCKRIERPDELRGFKKIRDRSPSEYENLLEWIDACLEDVPQEFIELNNSLKKHNQH